MSFWNQIYFIYNVKWNVIGSEMSQDKYIYLQSIIMHWIIMAANLKEVDPD